MKGEERRCPQCWKTKPYPAAFLNRKGVARGRCGACAEKYRGWEKKPILERFRTVRPPGGAGGVPRARLYLGSKNRKLGGIPVSLTSSETCPPGCSFLGRGCYAEFHHTRATWTRVGRTGNLWATFCRSVAALPPGTLWRHNEAGDLPGDGDIINLFEIAALVKANEGLRGFTFTHKPVRGDSVEAQRNRIAVGWANQRGFVINLSADSLADADELYDVGIGPVAVVLPADAPRSIRTPRGRRVTVCPAETAALTCLECQLCAVPGRRAIVGFRAHGQGKALVTELVKARRL